MLVPIVVLLFHQSTTAQNAAINADGSTPDANATLDIKSFTRGLLIPRTSSRLAIPGTKGLLFYDITVNSFYYNDGNSWLPITGNAASLSGTANYVPKFTAASVVGNSQIVDTGQYVGIGTTNPTSGLTIVHNGGIVAKGNTGNNNHFILTAIPSSTRQVSQV